MTLPDWPLWVPCLLFGVLAVEWGITQSRIRHLEDLPEDGVPDPLPSVCLCIPARNEEAEIGRALDSWLAQEHPALRVVVVDDGSTDRTPEILAPRAAARPERLRVLRNDTLPPGWLGKNHALHLATRTPEALAAEWLVFADADVQADPGLLARAFAYLERRPADVLALVPAVDTVGWAERLVLPMGAMGFLWLSPPQRVADPKSPFFCGVGAFTLIRRAAYDAIGGHAADPLEAVDDMMLAGRAKRAGFLNRMACGGRPVDGSGGGGLHLRMYRGLGDLVRSMRKNALAFPWLWGLAPLLAPGLVALFAVPLLLATFGWPVAGLLIWLVWPAMVAEAHQRTTGRGADPIWMLWPLVGLVLAAGVLWAFWDRLRGLNHWRGREVRLS